MEVRILTLVTNIFGNGPGHSAVAVGDTVYTFEDAIGGWLDSDSGWIKTTYAPYLAKNEHRPVLAQTIVGATSGSVTNYVEQSIQNDDDYVGSGVCSQQVARAVNSALPPGIDFDPEGFDTPHRVYHCARQLALVSKEEYSWPGRGSIPMVTWAGIVNKLKSDYPVAFQAMDLTR